MTNRALVEAIAVLLPERADGLTSTDLAEWAGVSHESAANALYRQYRAGKLTRKRGDITGPGRPAWRYLAA